MEQIGISELYIKDHSDRYKQSVKNEENKNPNQNDNIPQH